MNRVLEGKVVVITGASRGIGEAAALAVAEAGGKVVIGDLLAEGEAVAAAINNNGGEAVYVKTDVSKNEDVQRLVATAVSKFGRLDGAFNNAAIFRVIGRTCDEPEEYWDAVMAVNVTGVWHCVRAEINQMLKQGGGGSIVNTASAAGLVGMRYECAYTVSKHAVVGLSKAAALDYALDRIRVNALCPGVVDTPLVRSAMAAGITEEQFVAYEPMGRLGKPSELAPAAVFLLSDAASFVTGTAFSVDGGFVAQ